MAAQPIAFNTSDERSQPVDTDNAATVGGNMHPMTAADGTQIVEYKGVRLAHGIEQIQFDEGVYVGTIDVDGAMSGFGKATWNSGDTYEGEWLNDYMHGKGVYTWADGDYYRGDYVNGYMCGYGEMKDAIGVYTGDWVDDMRQGRGKMIYNNGNEYDGEWLAGMRHGLGKLVEPAAGTTYEGEFVRNEKEGKGVLINVDGDIYEGTFAEGKPNGRGTYIWADGAKYIGSFKDGVKHGEGCEWLANGDWIAGNFVNGEHDKQQEIHKAVEAGDEDPELPDDMQAALQPLALDKLRKLRSAADGSDDDSGLESDGEENNKDQNGKEGASPFSAALAVTKECTFKTKGLRKLDRR
ncbi:MORN domaincontaining protein [Angomonas deanei]|nr:MORN domaincontaining protein [Angomonas deanei]|eukprot:EPY41601.1 MORN domaincontaining protein [Angomonas deanei]